MTHNRVLIEPVRELLTCHGGLVTTEARVQLFDSRLGFIDLLADMPGDVRVAVEAELGSRRAGKDIEKAESAGADLLAIVTPCPATARACRAAASRAGEKFQGEILVHPLGLMLQALGHRFPLIPGAICPEKKR